MKLVDIYYTVRPLIPRSLQIRLRQAVARRKRAKNTHSWPILPGAGVAPPGWKGWSGGKKFAVVLTHDVETQVGHDNCHAVMDLEESLGFRSSFNFVPQRYEVSGDLRNELATRGFEVGVHGLCHDGHLFCSRRTFEARRSKINHYIREWGAEGFRAPSMRKRLDWIRELDIRYDSSTFDTDPFEPDNEGVDTVFPFWVSDSAAGTGYLELPYTLAQDFTLFVVLGEDSPAVWLQKLEWIAEKGGLALLNTHPDYMATQTREADSETYPIDYYRQFLETLNARFAGRFWHALPREVADHFYSTPDVLPTRTLQRMCMVSYSFYDDDNRVRRYAESLARKGDAVEAIALRTPEREKEGVLNGVRVSRIQARTKNEKTRFDYFFRIARFWLKSSAVLAVRHLRSPYSVIHVHSVPDFEIFAAWFPKLLGAKLILDIHDIVPEFYCSKFGVGQDSTIYKMLLKLERASCRFADHVIAANHIWYERLKQRAVPAEKCSVFINYVDTNVFYPRERTRNDDRLIIIYPGGFQKHQGVDIAIRAFHIVQKSVPNLEFHIYGNGSEEGALKTLVEELNLQERVRVFEVVPFQSIPDILANADVGVVPKRAEGFGNEAYSTKILEYMSQGLPVILSRTKIDSLYFDDSNVMFFESGDVEGLAEAMTTLATKPDVRKELSANATSYLQTQHWKHREHEYLELIDGLGVESGSGE